MQLLSFGLKGRVKASVIKGKLKSGAPEPEKPALNKKKVDEWMRNLWLNRGLDQVASTPICDCFSVAAKGTGATPTTEIPANSNTYSITNGGTTLTQTAGARAFTGDDEGKVIILDSSPVAQFTIVTFTDATHVVVSPAASAAATNKKIDAIYTVDQTALDAEVSRTQDYSTASGDNSTATAGNARTFTRTFIFPSENTAVEFIPAENTYSQTGTTISLVDGSRNFSAADVGAKITFLTANVTATVVSWSGGSPGDVVVDVSQTVPAQAISISRPSAKKEVITGTYSRSGTTVTRATGTRDFTIDDEGKVINFGTDDVETIITTFTDAANVTVDVSGMLAAQSITLYGFTDYNEVGFSHTLESGGNINVRVVLASSVRCYVATGLRASDQLKLTYQCTFTIGPSTVVTGTLAGVIIDPGNLMSGNKAGKYTIESFATSVVATSGETDISFPDLEPFYPGSAALSLDSDAPDPLSGKTRSNAVAAVQMTADDYTPGRLFRNYEAVFGLNDAINSAWRTLMQYDPDSTSSIFAFVFNAPQRKDGDHTLQITFRKSWNRDLS